MSYVNPRTLVQIVKDSKEDYLRIIIDEDKLDLFSYPEYELKQWQPKITLKSYKELSKIFIDIETSGLSKENDVIELIGLYNHFGVSVIINCLPKDINQQLLINNLNKKFPYKYSNDNLLIINCGNESNGLKKLLEILIKKEPDILAGFNSFEFDLPFIIHKLEKYNLRSPFYVSQYETVFRSAQKFGSPSIYNSIYFNGTSRGKTAVLDLYHQVLAWDFVARKLTRHSLKQAVLQTGLRKEARLELSYPEMRSVVSRGDLERYSEYLIYDLEDTKLLGDMLIPAIYYQKLFLPTWKLQKISHSGNGSKWNDILKQSYNNQNLPETAEKMLFTGGLTGANKGLFFNVSKIDVASMYPNIMLTYGIQSIKDANYFQLSLLKYLLDFRINLKIKKQNKTATNEEKQTEGAYKVIINSGYGSLGTQGIEFNDYIAAALVTAYGRAILKLMVAEIVKNGGKIVSIDSDGIYYSTDDPTFELNKRIHQLVNSAMPKGINLDYELEAKTFYVPPKESKKITIELIDYTENIKNDGLKKNYIIVGLDGKIKSKGRYVKRDRCVLEKEFQPTLVKLLSESKDKAYEYYQKILLDLSMGVYPVDNLKITRKIRKGEKELVDLGFGKEQDVISYYFAESEIQYGKRGQPLKNKKQIKTMNGIPGGEYYISIVKALFQEIWQFVD